MEVGLVAAALLGMLLAGPVGESSEKSKKSIFKSHRCCIIFLQNESMSHDGDTPSIIPKR